MLFDKRRFLKLLDGYSHVLIHKNKHIDISYLENKFNTSIQTSDLRFTKGRFDEAKNVDVVIYIGDSHEPVSVSRNILSTYLKTCDNVIYVSDKKSGKRVGKSFTAHKQFYIKKFFVAALKETKETSDIENYSFELNKKNTSLSFTSAPGLFSYKQVDAGTNFLLDTLPKLSGDVLDFGCGVGVIGLYLSKQGMQVTLTDSNFRSLKYCELNAKQNDVKATIKPSYLLRNITMTFDYVVSNPPTHTSLEEVEELFKDLSSVCKKKAYLVINNIVNYERISKKYFKTTSVLDTNDQFKIMVFSNQ